MTPIRLDRRWVALLWSASIASVIAPSGFVAAQVGNARIDSRHSATGDADPMPVALGELPLGTVRVGAAGLNAAIVELQRWGWPMQSVSVNRMELRTDWLFLSDPILRPDNGIVCPKSPNSGLRVYVVPRRRTADSVAFALRGDAFMAAGLDRRLAENNARASFATIGGALRQALHAVAESTDTSTADMPGIMGEIGGGTASNTHGCAVITRPPSSD